MQESKQGKFANNQNTSFDPNFVQIAVVKDNRDPSRTGKLKVWIQGSQALESTKESWITCRYLSAFAGRTKSTKNADKFKEFPKSYGFWATPPDVGTSVAVFFANGEIHDAYWFGGVFDDRMNSMVPGMNTQVIPGTGIDSPLPTTDYDRSTISTNISDKYTNSPQIEGLKKQNLLYDTELGPVNRSSTRQTVSTVYGMSTPRQNSIVLDDGYTEEELNAPSWDDDSGYQNTNNNNPSDDNRIGSRKNEGICLRTRSGAQILLSESNGNVFIINRDGTARVELTPEGFINIHSDRSMNIRTDEDMNFTIKKDWNVDVGGKLNFSVKGDAKVEIIGKFDTKVQGEVVFNTNSSMRLYAQGELRFQSGSNTEITSGAVLNCTSKDITSIKGSSINLTGGSTNLSIAGDVSTNSIYKGQDFQSGSVGLNSHIHTHAVWSSPSSHSDNMSPPVKGGAGSNHKAATPSQPANDVPAEVPVQAQQQVVTMTAATAPIQLNLQQDMLYDDPGSGITYYQTYESLGLVQPCTGTIRQYGYWGKDVKNEAGKNVTRNGWIIQCQGEIVAPESGTLQRNNTGFVINHGNGYKTVYYDAVLKAPPGDVSKGDVIAESKSVWYFEVRTVDAALYGFGGTVDPGLFYSTITGVGADCANKSLTKGKRSNPNAQPSQQAQPSSDSTELVTITSVPSIGSGYAQRGSKKSPKQVQVQPAQSGTGIGKKLNAGLHYDPNLVPVGDGSTTWQVKPTDTGLRDDMIAHEGLAREINGKLYPYKDHLGFLTIGIGHYVKTGENFSQGISKEDAYTLFAQDISFAVKDARKIYETNQLQTGYIPQYIITTLVFWLGSGGARGYKNVYKALKINDYRKAAYELRDSLAYRQVPKRMEYLARLMERCV